MENPSNHTKIFERLILIGHIEGYSYLFLLGIAMPLKYIWNMPLAVKFAGSVHGFLFVWFCFLLFQAWLQLNWSFFKPILGFMASLVPFGTFFLRRLLA